jgi:hypothetical protein
MMNNPKVHCFIVSWFGLYMFYLTYRFFMGLGTLPDENSLDCEVFCYTIIFITNMFGTEAANIVAGLYTFLFGLFFFYIGYRIYDDNLK